MSTVLMVSAAAVFAAVCGALLKRGQKEIALLFSLAAAVLVFLCILPQIETLTSTFREWAELSGMPEVFGALLKALGIVLIGRITADLCKDAGESANSKRCGACRKNSGAADGAAVAESTSLAFAGGAVVMKKRILRVFLALTVFILLLSLPVRADEAELYQNSGADTLMEALPEEAQSLLQNVGADPMETPAPGAATKLFSALSEGFRAEWTAPARALLTLLVLCVLCRLVQEFAAKELSYAVSVCGALCAAVTLLSPMASLLEQAARVTDAAAVFLLAAVPVYAGLLFTAGNTVTAPTYGALSLAAANAVSVLSSAVLIPVLRVFLAFSVASAVTSFDLKRLTDALYKVIKWALVLTVTVYTGVLSVQTMVANSAEMAGGKAAKMLVSGAIPIVGSAFSDAFSVIVSGAALVKNGVGAFGLLASLAIFLPLCIKAAAWLLICFCAGLAAEVLGLKPLASFLNGCAAALRLLIAAVCSVGAVAVVSAAVVLCVRGAYA